MNESPATGFLTDDVGTKSSMRLMSFISLFAAIMFGVMELNAQSNPPYLTLMFLLGAFAPKALQKFIEDRFLVQPKSSREQKS